PDRRRAGRRIGSHRSLEERKDSRGRYRSIHEKGRRVSGSRQALPARGPRSFLDRFQPSDRRGDFLRPQSPKERRLGGVYLVASPQKPVSHLLETVTAALEGGVSMVQLRDKGVYSPEEKAEAGRGLRQISRHFGVPFLVNDDPPLARRMDADGVHVGRDDPSPLPVFAIGGVNASNAALLARHRVAGVAVVSAIMEAPDPRHAAETIRRAFSAASSAGCARRAHARGNARARSHRTATPATNVSIKPL